MQEPAVFSAALAQSSHPQQSVCCRFHPPERYPTNACTRLPMRMVAIRALNQRSLELSGFGLTSLILLFPLSRLGLSVAFPFPLPLRRGSSVIETSESESTSIKFSILRGGMAVRSKGRLDLSLILLFVSSIPSTPLYKIMSSTIQHERREAREQT